MAVRPRLNLALIQTKLRKMAFFICMDAGSRTMNGAIAEHARIGFTAMDGGYAGIAGANPSSQKSSGTICTAKGGPEEPASLTHS